MSEQKIQTKILKKLDELGFYVVKTIVSNKKGVPDILACSPEGRFVAIEVKFGKNKASKLQEYNIQQINKRNGCAVVCWSLETLLEHLEKEGII